MQEINIEGTITEVFGSNVDLLALYVNGNWAAHNALHIDRYKFDDGPFYYGKIGHLGYIIAKKDFTFLVTKSPGDCL